jgi:Glucose / Sorbosone dehydrogenase
VKRIATLAIACVMACPAAAAAQVRLIPIASGLNSPLFVSGAHDGTRRLFIVEQAGVIRVMPVGGSSMATFLDIRSKIRLDDEQGLLGLAFHPFYSSNRRFYVYYTRVADGAIVVAEYQASASNRDGADTTERILLTIPHPTNTNHNGGMLAFGPDGYLYIGVGDGGSGNDPPNNAQNKEVLLGKILRLDVNARAGGLEYGIPISNPFFGSLAGRDEIFAYGMRNPWRFSFDRVTTQLWVADVGQNAREEVNTPIVSGGNYGWRVYEGTACTNLDPTFCTPANYVFPIFDYTHTSGRCSITGGYVYRGTVGSLPTGTYVYGDYCTGEIFTWSGGAQRLLLDTALRISSFGEDDDGEIYVVDIGGSVSRIANESGGECQYDVPSALVARRAGATLTISVSTTIGCSWSATSRSEWIAVAGESHSGSGVVSVVVAPQPGWPIIRTGSLTVAGKVVVILQY